MAPKIKARKKTKFQTCFVKKVYLTISQISQENTALESLFNKVVNLQHLNLLKNDSNRVVFCEFWKIFKNTFFTKHLWVTASEHQKLLRFSDIFRGYGNLTSVGNRLKKALKKSPKYLTL